MQYASPPTLAAPNVKADTRAWFKKKRVIIPAAAIVLFGAAVASQGGKSSPLSVSQPVASATTSIPTSQPTEASDPAPSEEASEEASEPAAPNSYDEAYGTSAVVTKSGRGDATVKLPSGAAAGLVKLTHNGSSNFAASVLDSHNKPTGDLLVNEIGSYSGTTAYGFSLSDDGVKIQISADGVWSFSRQG